MVHSLRDNEARAKEEEGEKEACSEEVIGMSCTSREEVIGAREGCRGLQSWMFFNNWTKYQEFLASWSICIYLGFFNTLLLLRGAALNGLRPTWYNIDLLPSKL